MAYAYLVNTSEDGIIGVYSNYKKAKIAAINYLENCWDFDGKIDLDVMDKWATRLINSQCSAIIDKFPIE